MTLEYRHERWVMSYEIALVFTSDIELIEHLSLRSWSTVSPWLILMDVW